MRIHLAMPLARGRVRSCRYGKATPAIDSEVVLNANVNFQFLRDSVSKLVL